MALFGLLSISERLSVAHAMRAMMRLGRSGRAALANISFGDWLARHHQSPAVIRKFYDPVVISALNEDTPRAAALYAIEIFQEAMLRNRHGYTIGLPDCPLQTLYARRPCRDIRFGKRVTEIVCRQKTISTVRLSSGEKIAVSAVVLATNHHAATKLIAPEWLRADTRFVGLDRPDSVPILGAHLWFDRPVMDIPHAALIAGPVQWLFRKDAQGSAVHGVISAARQWVSTPHEHCAALFEHQLRALFRKPQAKLVRHRIVIEKRATFSPSPGVDRIRPPQAPPPGGIENLFLAGDYTRTGWPATMEGAVRSGYMAAGALLKALPHTAGLPSPLANDLNMEFTARWFSGSD
jgi:zeta-carotene desaturase